MKVHVEPIKWSNILRWAIRTARADRKTYYSKTNRTLSVGRLLHLIAPNLRKPIFIVGAPRSGTTFLGSCLAQIPEISYHFEPIVTKAAARYVYEGRWGIGKAKWFYRTVYAWLMRLHLDADLRFAEKTPQNSFIIDFLFSVFPDAQFIHIIRDGRDVALSYSKKPWLQANQAGSGKTEPGGYPYGPYVRFWVEPCRVSEFETTSDIHRCIWAWRRFTESVLETAVRLPRTQYYEVKYESLVTKPVDEANKLLDFLRISNEKSRHIFQNTVVSRAKSNSVGKWKYELEDYQLQQIEKEAGFLLRQLGYVS